MESALKNVKKEVGPFILSMEWDKTCQIQSFFGRDKMRFENGESKQINSWRGNGKYFLKLHLVNIKPIFYETIDSERFDEKKVLILLTRAYVIFTH
jgi:hypothetical protein